MSVDPADIDGLDEDATDEEIDEWVQEREQQLKDRIQTAEEELTDAQREGLRALSPNDGLPTATTTVMGEEIEVRTEIPPKVPVLAADAVQTSDVSGRVDAYARCLSAMIEEDGFGDESMWWAYYSEHGEQALDDVFRAVMQPALDKAEVVEKFPSDEAGAATDA